jgi:hypothetical protein
MKMKMLSVSVLTGDECVKGTYLQVKNDKTNEVYACYPLELESKMAQKAESISFKILSKDKRSSVIVTYMKRGK